MKKSTIYAIVAVLVVVIIIAGVAAYYYGKGGNGGSGTTPTPSPVPSATPVSIASATSLQFSADATSGGTTTTLNFAGENIGTSNLLIRIDLPAYNQSYVLNYGHQASWTSTDGGKTWTLDSSFTNDNNIWGARWVGEVSALGNWTGTGDYTYSSTTGGVTSTVKIYNIQVNPSLPASLFTTS